MSLEKRPCRGCGMELLFARSPAGTRVPLQAVTALYALDDQGKLFDSNRRQDSVLHRVVGYTLDSGDFVGGKDSTVYVNHFQTCPKRDDFKKEKT